MSFAITGARWANPEQTRVVVQTADRGAVLLKPERAEWELLDAWIKRGNSIAPYVPPAISYREGRMRDYALELGKDPGDIIRTLGDVLDVLIAELNARGAPVTAEFAAMLVKIAAIKARHPKL